MEIAPIVLRVPVYRYGLLPIIKEYGTGTNDPFSETGKGKYGFLFNLSPVLAMAFLEKIKKHNRAPMEDAAVRKYYMETEERLKEISPRA